MYLTSSVYGTMSLVALARLKRFKRSEVLLNGELLVTNHADSTRVATAKQEQTPAEQIMRNKNKSLPSKNKMCGAYGRN